MAFQTIARPVADGVLATIKPLELSIIVPTFNEVSNVRELLSRIERALGSLRWEIIFVDDDSPDGTSDLVRSIALYDPRIRILRRVGRRGVSTACIEGMLASAAPIIAIMDADLQHDENTLRPMLTKIVSGGADLVVATRYADGGTAGTWTATCLRMSQLATRASELMLGHTVSDPMSGFFMLKRSLLESTVRKLSGRGYKILLDILSSTESKPKIEEVAYSFRNRFSGTSKLDSFVIWQYGMLLVDKSIGRFIPADFISFCIIGGIGFVAHMVVLVCLFKQIGVDFTLAQTLATLVAMTVNFSLNNVLTYRDRRLSGIRWWLGLLNFSLLCSVGAIGNVGIASYLYRNNAQWAVAAIAGIIISAVWNYGATRLYTWGHR